MSHAQLRVMASGTRRSRRPFTARGLHAQARFLHIGRIRWATPAWIVVLAALALSILGILAIGTTEPGFARRQVMFLPIAIFAACIVAVPDYRLLRRLVLPLAILTMLLLVFVLIPLVPNWLVRPYNGARRWINLGVMDFQPSELAKVVWVLAMATWFRVRPNLRTVRGFVLPFLATAIPMGLIVIEPDLGTALLFIPTLLAMLLVAGARLQHLGIVLLAGALLAGAVMFTPVKGLLKPHQQDRISALLAQIEGDDRYRDDIGFQGDRAMTIAGAGGLSGLGAKRTATLVRFNALPEDHNDMIFAVITCRWGAVGAMGTWALYLVLAVGGFLTAALSRDLFGRLLATGLVAILFVQMLINTGMTIGLLPITGMTLPFVSSGGSSLVMTWLMIGLVLNVGLRRPRHMERWEATPEPVS
ncbi:MAG: FtsW/RodA/SpoVE family cell cycle protein [Phycisphaerales bacterium]|nr:FtsW/RodA/SpoVE family cell cycle protein [Phycisphaerales bacterium]